MIPWSSVHRTLSLGLVGAVVGATVLVGSSAPSDPSDAVPVSAEGEDSTLQEQTVPLVDDPEADAGEPAPEALDDAPQELEDEVEDTGQGGGDPEAPVAELERTTTDPFNMVGVTWEGGADLRVEVSHRTAGQWSAFEDLEVEPVDPTEGGRAGTEPLWINDGADGVSVKITSASGELPRDVKVATIDPGEDGLIAPTSGAPGQPSIIMRSSWGAKSASCSTGNPATRGATIHHTAGNNTYSEAQVAGILRSYQDYHRSRGWCDIGYNFLVDRFGRIYEGRVGGITNMVRGAHAGTNGANTYTVGIAMMGTFTDVMPTAATRESVANLVAWRFGRAGLPAKGTHTLDGKTQQRIIGHRDVKATECPGRTAYTWVTGGLRDTVASKLSGASTPQYRWKAPTGLKVTQRGETSLGLSWSQVETAKRYVVQVSKNSSMSGAVSRTFDATSGTVSGLDPSTTYYARVMVQHTVSGEALSPWSGSVSAATATPAPAPEYRWKAPTGLKVTQRGETSLGLSWSQVETAKRYVVQVSKNSSMSGAVSRTFDATSGTVSGLDPSTTYYVRVMVQHTVSGAALSPWSGTVSAATATPKTYRWAKPMQPKLTGSSSSSLTFWWSRVGTAKKYVVQVSESPSMTNARNVSTTTNSVTIGSLKASTTYYVRVQARHSKTDAELSPWSGNRNAKTSAPSYRWAKPMQPKLTGSSSSSLNFWWSRVGTAKRYVVQVSESSSMTNPRNVATTTNSVSLKGLKANTTYYVRVQARHSKSDAALSPWSGNRSARTSAAAAASPSSVNSRDIGSASSITFKGRGFGHGIGMSQYGAYGGAQSGSSAQQILARYYPGTSIGNRTSTIRVLVSADNNGSTEVVARSGMRFIQGSRDIALPATVSGRTVSRWRIQPASSDNRRSILRYRSGSTWYDHSSTTWTGSADFKASTMDLVLPNGSTVTYRTRLRAAQPSSASTKRQTVNVLTLENYTRGVVAREVPASWPEQTLRAQAIAARTYGARSISSGGWYDICDTTSCQVFGGVNAEHSRTDAAVKATAGQIVTHQGGPAFTQFSSSSGGFTNQGSQPYLRPVNDPWDATSANPNRSWTQNVSVSTIRTRYPSIGTPQRLRVTKRNGHGADGGRVTSLQVVGSSGSVTVTGPAARAAFGLKSDWFGF